MVNSNGSLMHPPESTQVNVGVSIPKEVYGGGDSISNGIEVPEGKLAGGYGMCRICGKVLSQATNYCPDCGTKVVIENRL